MTGVGNLRAVMYQAGDSGISAACWCLACSCVCLSMVPLHPGSYQMTWNLQQPSAAASRRNRPAARKYRELPKQANEIVTQRSARAAPRWPATDAELLRAPDELQALHAALIGVQRPYEWLRLLDEDGDPAQMKRFRGDIMDRLPAVRNAILQLGRALRLSPSEVDGRFREANRAQLDENAELYARAGRIVKRDVLQSNARSRQVDWRLTGWRSPARILRKAARRRANFSCRTFPEHSVMRKIVCSVCPVVRSGVRSVRQKQQIMGSCSRTRGLPVCVQRRRFV